ncbi:MAG: hypothetical protein IKN65_04765 [Clostridia bacterium]|nr:hypothetical protein [Clostridia bacterium]MBR4262239.1 hypothetical protein [Bacilli bacterium]
MEVYYYDQFEWNRLKQECAELAEKEKAKKMEILQKKNAAATASVNLEYLYNKYKNASSLMNNAVSKTDNITENTVKKHKQRINELSDSLESTLSSIEQTPDRLRKIEDMYYAIAQNHQDNYDEYLRRQITCEQSEADAKSNNMTIYGKWPEPDRIEYGRAHGTFYGTIKDEMEGVTWEE